MTLSWARQAARRVGARRVAVRRRAIPFGGDVARDLHTLGLRPTTIFDVGANIGQTVFHMRRYFPAATIVAFEPVPGTLQMLRRNVDGADRVTPVGVALSDRIGRAAMTGVPGMEQNTLLHDGGGTSGPVVEVPLVTLDSYLGDGFAVGPCLLKIDSEGHELAVLRGADKVLRSGAIAAVIAECEFTDHAVPHTKFVDLVKHLTPLGFAVACFYCHGIGPVGWEYGDVLFLGPTFRPGPTYASANSWALDLVVGDVVR